MEDNNYSKILKSIDSYCQSKSIKSKNLYINEQIASELIAKHKKLYAKIGTDEKCLLVVNKKIIGSIGGYCYSGIVITDKFLYYKCVKDSFFSGFFAASTSGKIPLEEIRKISIGEHDNCYGPAYVGHQLIINGKVVGLLRMGGSVEYDEEMMTGLEMIFKFTN